MVLCTHGVYLKIMQLRRREGQSSHPANRQEPLPSRRMEEIRAVEKHAEVVRESRADGAHQEHRRAEAAIADM